MTTAARPTFHPAVGGEDQGYYRMEGGTRQISARDLPGHTRLKLRRQGQGTKEETIRRDMKAELRERELKASAASARSSASGTRASSDIGDRPPPVAIADSGKDADDIVAADVSDDSDDDEDETAELMRELERIKKEREEDATRKAIEEKTRDDQEKQDQLLRGNPLLAGGGGGFNVKRRWDDDVVFRNQARTEPETKKRFINDTIRNDFHKKFLNKYVK
mmetsp:Transcript_28696/g.58715  ORF Transcript_28696/g.58715 Transcript_28696/m.58715 type:complete len:220 (+) Transcript_28696:70-729(+)|eukprot:CAMPEP_0181317932 /NCGR_PEP_ID=MMETSP1101-20121128/16733_1 /TAXON_ID=46948 /ORGANISM="Rhodomonas abbreviata, Strain Caron Lab Isolate" /LENGTH=219 /DNA_ID=CAMNT_0023425361 /DNA_START=62 /DNA_END=721 /DNA_ORIENTATION=-